VMLPASELHLVKQSQLSRAVAGFAPALL
jgi:hypothetical protein